MAIDRDNFKAYHSSFSRKAHHEISFGIEVKVSFVIEMMHFWMFVLHAIGKTRMMAFKIPTNKDLILPNLLHTVSTTTIIY